MYVHSDQHARLTQFAHFFLHQHDPSDEPTCPSLSPEFFEFDLQKNEIDREQLRELLYDEIVAYRPLI